MVSIGKEAFACHLRAMSEGQKGCENLREVVFPPTLREIGEAAFLAHSNLKDLKFPNSLELIGPFAFQSLKYLDSLTIPVGLRNVGTNAFRGCESLSTLWIDSANITFGGGAFVGTQIGRPARLPLLDNHKAQEAPASYGSQAVGERPQ